MNDEKTTKTNAAKPLSVLLVEDSVRDAELVIREIKSGGFNVTWRRVENEADMKAALDAESWDAVISDYRLPHFDGLLALRVLQEKGLDIPFIIVSGTIGEETAVAVMKAGAHDYLMKDNLARLVPAVERELRDAASRAERKQAEEAQKESEARFRIAQDMSPDGFTILRPVRDAQERIIDFTWVYENPAIARLNGTEPAAVVGKRLLELFPGHRDTPFLRAYQEVAESGKVCEFEAGYSGESLSRPTSFRIVVVPMVGDIAILAQDITERKRAEHNQEASELRYRRLFEAAQDGILILDADTGMIVDVNPFLETLLGWSRKEFLGKALWDIGLFKDVVSSKASFAELQARGYVRYEGLPLETRKGLKINVEFVSNVYCVDNQKVIQCNIRDITERKKAEARIQDQINELQRWHDAMLGREERVQELKREVNELAVRLGENPRYGEGKRPSSA